MKSTDNIHPDVLRFLYILVVSTLSEDKHNEGWSEPMFFLCILSTQKICQVFLSFLNLKSP